MKTNLLALVAQIDIQEATSVLPSNGVADGETVIGKLTDEHIRLWGVIGKQRSVIAELRAALQKEWEEPSQKHAAMHVEDGPDFLDPEHPDHEALHERLGEIKSKFDALAERDNMLRNLFWTVVRFDLDIVDNSSIGIRSGGEVVSLPASKGHPLQGLLIGEPIIIEIGEPVSVSKPPGFLRKFFGKAN